MNDAEFGSDDFEYEYEYSDDDDEMVDDDEANEKTDDTNMVSSSNSSSSNHSLSEENANPNPLVRKRSRENASGDNNNNNRKNDNDDNNNNDEKSGHTTTQLPFPAKQQQHHRWALAKSAIPTVPSQDLRSTIERQVSDVSGALGIPVGAAAPLLCRHAWSTQAVLEAFMNDPERALGQAGVTQRCQAGHCNNKSSVAAAPTEMDCSICMDSVNAATDAMFMPCGHGFCCGCWNDYLVNTIQREGATCMEATCPEATCTELLTEREVQAAAPELLPKYQHFQLQHFVESVGRWCPGKGCSRVALLKKDDASVAFCEGCSLHFCGGCGDEPHAPVSCANLQKWHVKGSDESETVNWLSANTKNCPKCGTRIEKNGGCMYISCRNCRHGFCWVCFGTHHTHTCNAYNEKKDPGADERLRAKNELERYLHYYTRYQGHKDAQKYAEAQLLDRKDAKDDDNEKDKQNQQQKKKTLGSSSTSSSATTKKETDKNGKPASKSSQAPRPDFIDLPDFLKDANRQLVHCRHVLKYTYVFAFYHFAGDQTKQNANNTKETFEFHQGILEGLTEDLSKATEKPLDEVDQQDVVNRTRAIGSFIKNVLAHVDNGMDEDESDSTGVMMTVNME